jgi:hypothetical protein
MADPHWPEESPQHGPSPRKRSALRRIADDIAASGAVVGSNQMPEIQAARQIESERPVEPGVLGRVPGWIWIAIVVALVIILAFFVEPQPIP